MNLIFLKRPFTAIALVLALSLFLTSCTSVSAGTVDLNKGVTANKVEGKTLDDSFKNYIAGLSFNIFKTSINDVQTNTLVSPTSVILALSMASNGASGNTLSQMLKLLGNGISEDDLNKYLYGYVQSLKSSDKAKIGISNSIWFTDSDKLKVNSDFLQVNANYYKADAYKADFAAAKTADDINNWVKTKTDGMIDKIVDKIDPQTVMYLINAVVFDAQWENIYYQTDISKRAFTKEDGTKKQVDFMSSTEHIYLEDEVSTGFIKPYADGAYSFVALLPKEGMKMSEYLTYLNGDSFMSILKNASSQAVSAVLPKFSYDYKVSLNDQLKAMGMGDAFDAQKADFSKIGQSSGGKLYISDVLHKTFIAVDEKGTKAGAVTKVEIGLTAMPMTKSVDLSRPFVYAIIDNSTNLPVFIGTVMNVG